MMWTIFSNKFSNTEAQLITNFHCFCVYLSRLRVKSFRKRNHTLYDHKLFQADPQHFCQNEATIGTSPTQWHATISRHVHKNVKDNYWLVMYACPHGTAWLPLYEFSWNLKFWGIFENLLHVKSDMNNVDLTWKPM